MRSVFIYLEGMMVMLGMAICINLILKVQYGLRYRGMEMLHSTDSVTPPSSLKTVSMSLEVGTVMTPWTIYISTHSHLTIGTKSGEFGERNLYLAIDIVLLFVIRICISSEGLIPHNRGLTTFIHLILKRDIGTRSVPKGTPLKLVHSTEHAHLVI
jgi:hypothetical protein